MPPQPIWPSAFTGLLSSWIPRSSWERTALSNRRPYSSWEPRPIEDQARSMNSVLDKERDAPEGSCIKISESHYTMSLIPFKTWRFCTMGWWWCQMEIITLSIKETVCPKTFPDRARAVRWSFTKHFWNFTAKQCCRILLDNWRSFFSCLGECCEAPKVFCWLSKSIYWLK